MTGHKKRVDDVLQKSLELLEASYSLRREKIELEEKLLGRLLELQKALEEVSDLQENMDSVQSEILSLLKRSTGAVPRNWRSSVSFEPSRVAWRVAIWMWRS